MERLTTVMMRILLAVTLITGLVAPDCTALSSCLQRTADASAGCCCPAEVQAEDGCCCEKDHVATRGGSQADTRVRNLEPATMPLCCGISIPQVSWSEALLVAPAAASNLSSIPLFLLKGSFLI